MAENTNEDEIAIVSLEDEQGNEHEFEIVDNLEVDGKEYYALLPYFENPEDMDKADAEGAYELNIMQLEKEGDEDILSSIEDDKEYQKIAAMFEERMGIDQPEPNIEAE